MNGTNDESSEYQQLVNWASQLPIFLQLPKGSFSSLHDLALELPDRYREIAQAFVGNLDRAATVASIPFSFTFEVVYRVHFEGALKAAAIRIRAAEITSNTAWPPKEPLSSDQWAAAAEVATTEIQRRIATDPNRPFDPIAKQTLLELEGKLKDPNFAMANLDLFYQTLASTWGALELLANEVAIALLNEFPSKAANIIREAPSKKHFGTNILNMDLLSKHDFNLSSKMGDILLMERGLSSLEAIRDVFSVIAPAEHEVHEALNDQALWLLWQRRHIIVHRRGLVDTPYQVRTSDRQQEIGQPLRLVSRDLDAAFASVIKAGAALLSLGKTEAPPSSKG